jgi:CheY-like chemotaxis protein
LKTNVSLNDVHMTQKRILLADDSDLDVFLIKEAMRSFGIDFVIERCSDGRAALDRLTRPDTVHELDLIILDLNLPGMMGTEILRELRTRPDFDPIPIMMLTSSISERDQEDAFRFRADAFLTKPSNLADFLAEVGGALQEMLH